MATLHLYRFRYRDRLTGKWRTARCRLDAGAIRTRFPEAELLDVEAREVNAGGLAHFNPHRPPDAAAWCSAGDLRIAIRDRVAPFDFALSLACTL